VNDAQYQALHRRIRLLEKREPPLAAEFIDTAATTSDELRVIAPGWDGGEHAFGPVRWSPLGGTLPQAGDEAVIVERDDGVWQVIAWWSDNQTTAGIAQATIDALDARLDALESGPEALRQVGGSGQPAFQNSWANFDAVRPLTFYRHQGRTHLQGIIKSGTVGATIFTLPSGYAPVNADASNPLTFPVDSNAAYGRLFVYGTTGDVILGAGSNTYANLNGISFRHA
jgi:hypothetical protein